MQTSTRILTSAIGALFMVGSVNAATISDSYSFGSVSTPLDSGVPFSGTLDLFNTNLGTLTNVEVRFVVASVGGSGQGTSATGAPDATMDFVSTLTVSIVNPDPPNIRDASFNLIPDLSVTSTALNVFVPGDGGTSGVTPFNDVSQDTGFVQVAGGLISGFESVGPSTFVVDSNEAGITNFATSGGTVETSIYNSPDYYGTIEVRYTYTPIPEPSAALLGGLGALLLLRRRR